jgi:hypothetical protein
MNSDRFFVVVHLFKSVIRERCAWWPSNGHRCRTAPSRPAGCSRRRTVDVGTVTKESKGARPEGGRLTTPCQSISPMPHSRSLLSPDGVSGLRLRRSGECSECARMSQHRGWGQGCTGRREPRTKSLWTIVPGLSGGPWRSQCLSSSNNHDGAVNDRLRLSPLFRFYKPAGSHWIP